MTDRDVAPFNRRAAGYERSLLQPLFFRPIQERTLVVTASVCPAPASILDVGCGTGSLLRLAHERFPEARLVGTDAAAEMIRHAHADGAAFVHAPAERVPFAAASFDLVTSTMSFHHWKDQQQGINEAARVLAPGGVFVLADQLAAPWLRPIFALTRRRDRLHTPAEIETMLAAAGLAPLARRRVYDLDPLLLARTLRGRPPPAPRASSSPSSRANPTPNCGPERSRREFSRRRHRRRYRVRARSMTSSVAATTTKSAATSGH